MTMASLSHNSRFGLPGIDRIPVGMQACHFYGIRDQLVAALVPYFVARVGTIDCTVNIAIVISMTDTQEPNA